MWSGDVNTIPKSAISRHTIVICDAFHVTLTCVDETAATLEWTEGATVSDTWSTVTFTDVGLV
jgi:hypothetical protein